MDYPMRPLRLCGNKFPNFSCGKMRTALHKVPRVVPLETFFSRPMLSELEWRGLQCACFNTSPDALRIQKREG
jgi:hypothetical protein